MHCRCEARRYTQPRFLFYPVWLFSHAPSTPQLDFPALLACLRPVLAQAVGLGSIGGSLDAIVSNRGSEGEYGTFSTADVLVLSAGQRQLLAFARALLNVDHAPLLLLDECTAALDLHHEQRIIHLLQVRWGHVLA